MVRLEGGDFLMGSDQGHGRPSDGEGPVREVRLKPFFLDACAVTNRRFAAFVEATGHVTEAEKLGWSFVFAGLLPDDFPPTRAVARTPWWRVVEGAHWKRPTGPQSTLEAREDHPAVHISWNDAEAYCRWAGGRLPTEAEWEYAARGGLVRKNYPWGDELTPDGKHLCNIWQGTFPNKNTGEDGFLGTAPADAFPPNGYGLYNMSGNVWEWCADWFSRDFHVQGPRLDPRGPAEGTHKVIRGGSYLCHASYCNRYRVSARSGSTVDSSTGHMGFRCARDPGTGEGGDGHGGPGRT
ncbi:MAG TPA: formylglycine-generating enzyme family protein [Fibrobacteria bacterium]|nr:formylglycine-generating enzyme family protein [Fibrobacteria bacterium]